MDLDDISLFRNIATTGSLSAVARQLDMTPMAVSRRLNRLELQLGVRLVHRTTRSLSLTAEGEAFLPYADELIRTQDLAMSSMGRGVAGLTGTLKLTAPSVIGRDIVAPVLWEMLEEHPSLRVDLSFSDHLLNVPGRGLDVAIRVGTTLPGDMIATRIVDCPRVLCASPLYLERYGVPNTLEELKEHSCLMLHGIPTWPFTTEEGANDFRPVGRVSADTIDALRSACVAGMGIAFVVVWDVAQKLEEGSLVQIQLTDASPDVLGMWAVFPSRIQVPARVRYLIEKLRKKFDEVKNEVT